MVILSSLVIFFILRAYFLKYTALLTVLLIFLVLSIYLWKDIRPLLRSSGRIIRYFLTSVFWTPLFLLIFLIVYGFISPFDQWPVLLKTELVSLLFIVFFSGFIPIIGLLIADLIRFIHWMIHRFRIIPRRNSGKIRRNKGITVTSWFLGAVFFFILLGGMIFGKYHFIIKEHPIKLNGLPIALRGTRIVQISDIHLGSWLSRKKLTDAADLINQLNPDLILFTGDMFNYSTADGRGFQDILKRMKAPMGIFAILGNHDYGDYIHWPDEKAKKKNMQDLESFYRSIGWTLLRNEHQICYKGGDSIAIIGVENWGSTQRFQRFGDIDKARKGIETMEVQILLSHDPTYWDSIISRRYPEIDLTLSGHTHGGQFGFNCFGLYWSPVSLIYSHWQGLYSNPHSMQPQYLYVNQGLGTIGYTGRVGVRPEISLFVLE